MPKPSNKETKTQAMLAEAMRFTSSNGKREVKTTSEAYCMALYVSSISPFHHFLLPTITSFTSERVLLLNKSKALKRFVRFFLLCKAPTK